MSAACWRLVAGAGRGLLVLGVLGSSAGCDSSCKDLSEQICNCEPSQAEQQSCLNRVDAEIQRVEVTQEELDACATILGSGDCTCEALALGDLQACGLAVE